MPGESTSLVRWPEGTGCTVALTLTWPWKDWGRAGSTGERCLSSGSCYRLVRNWIWSPWKMHTLN